MAKDAKKPEAEQPQEKPEGLVIAEEMFAKYPHIEEIANGLPIVYDVAVRPGLFTQKMRKLTGNPELVLEDPNTKQMWDSKGRHMGTTKHQYETVQGKVFIMLVLYMIAKCGEDTGLNLDTFRFHEWDNGRLIEFLIENDPITFTNRTGFKEEIKQAISARTGYGGNYRHEIGHYEWRKVCKNGMWGWGKNAQLRLKHTGLNNTKIKLWCDTLHKVLNFQSERVEVYKLMDATDVSAQKREHFVRKLAGIPSSAKIADLHRSTKEVYDLIHQGIVNEAGRCGNSVWGLLQGATHYTNHLSAGASKWGVGESIRTKANKDFNDLAQKLCLAMLPEVTE